MDTKFFNASGGGDPTHFQNVIWFLGHPDTWVSLAIWLVFLYGIFKLSRQLYIKGKPRRLIMMLAVFAAFIVYYIWQMKTGQTLYVAGRGHEATQLHSAKRILVIISALFIFWIIFERMISRDKSKL